MTMSRKWSLNVLILVSAGLGACAADISVADGASPLTAGWQEVSNGALVRVRGALTEDMRFPLRVTLSPGLAEVLGNDVARSVCQASFADGKIVCRGLEDIALTVVASNETTTTFRVAAMNPGYADFVGIYLANSSEVSVEAEEATGTGTGQIRPMCTRRWWCEGTTYHVITQDCLWISSSDDYRCGGGDPVEDPPLQIIGPNP